MKITATFALCLAFLAALILPGTALAGGFTGGLPDEFVTGSYTLEEGETLNGNLFVMGGNATLENGSRVTGDIMVVGGNLSVDGEVGGNILATGGNVELKDEAVVNGDIRTIGTQLQRDSQAVINGQVDTDWRGPFPSPGGVRVPGTRVDFNPVFEMLSFFGQAFLMAALAVLTAMFWPRQVVQTAQAATSQPLIAGGLGLLTVPAALAAMVVLAITLILLPASLLLAIALAAAGVFGWVALGLEVGGRIAQLFNREWALPVSAGLGTLVLTLVAGGVGQFVDCIGWIVPTVLGLVGLGAVLLTRFGTQAYPSHRARTLIAPVPPAAPPVGIMAASLRPVSQEPIRPSVSPADDFPPAPTVTVARPPSVDLDEAQMTASGELTADPQPGAAVFPAEEEPPDRPDDPR